MERHTSDTWLVPKAGDAWVNDLRRKSTVTCVYLILIEEQIQQGRSGWKVMGIDLEDRVTNAYRVYEAFITPDILAGWYSRPDHYKELVRA